MNIFCCVTIIFCLSPIQITFEDNINIGIINFKRDTNAIAYATSVLAYKQLKLQRILPDNVTFTFFVRYGGDDKAAPGVLAEFYLRNDIKVSIGPKGTAAMVAAAKLASYWNLPIIGPGSSGDDLEDKTDFDTLSRVVAPQSTLGQAIKMIVDFYQWTKVGLITASGCASLALDGFINAFEAPNSTVRITYRVNIKDFNDGVAALQIIKNKARIIILCLSTDFTLHNLTYSLIEEAYDLNMANGEYLFIIPRLRIAIDNGINPWINNFGKTKNTTKQNIIFKNSFTIEPLGEQAEVIFPFIDAIKKELAVPNAWNVTVKDFPSNSSYEFMNNYFDGVYLYGVVYNKTLQAGIDAFNGKAFYQQSSCTSFNGATTMIYMDSDADREAEFQVKSMDLSGNFTRFLKIGLNASTICANVENILKNKTNQKMSLKIYRNHSWFTDDKNPPLDMPKCGFLGELCPEDTMVTILCVSIACLIMASVITYFLLKYRRKKYEEELYEMSWKINLDQLSSINKRNALGSMAALKSMISVNHSIGAGSKGSNAIRDCITSKINESQLCYGSYNGQTVTIKAVPRSKPIHFSRDDLIFLKNVKELSHENICMIYGMSFNDAPNILILWQTCKKGSLEDILFNDDIQLDSMFKASISRDIVKGLDYLFKSKIGFHGRLSASNCMVDSRWVIKIQDCGLCQILNKLIDGKFETIANREFYHMAPEVLCLYQNKVILKSEKSAIKIHQASDIYSLGMILYQILFRQELFDDVNKSPSEILHDLTDTSLKVTLRPKIPEKFNNSADFAINFVQLIKKCWADEPLIRPNIEQVKINIYGSTQKYSRNLIDHMISILEKYADNLENLVAERTEQVIEQQKRADMLLYQLLPKSVADALKSGQPVSPESYDCVTVFFSDIVGFTEICGLSSPMQVVQTLNQLYSQMDDIINKFDAYKVETIGDAYLVVSGLPERNGNQHAANIADMALSMRESITFFTVAHLTQTKLQVRIGIHSGPVAAGVVGLMMPRYCLFGDTVNVASRLESTSSPMKIHVSQNTFSILQNSSEYKFELRGNVELKGKGTCTTYWLIDKVSAI